MSFEVRRSNHNFDCEVCEALKGRYPKSFLFTGWHPHCRCHVIAITATEDEFVEFERKQMQGYTTVLKSKNEVNEVPGEYQEWVKKKFS